MRTYEITIKPTAGFGTLLKGDTIFGHFCWQGAYDEKLFGKDLDSLLSNYKTKPFAIFSSAYPRFCIGTSHYYAFKTPSLPPDEMFNLPEDKKQRIEKRKDNKAKNWMVLSKNKRFSSFKELSFLPDSALLEDIKANVSEDTRKRLRKAGTNKFITSFSQSHNKINRLVGTTGMEGFAPFTVEQHVFLPETELVLFVGIDENTTNIDKIKLGLQQIGYTGFGKDASAGLGRYELGEIDEIDLSKMGNNTPNACYTLAPCVPEKDTFTEMYFTPFTRFGRHGDVLAKSGNPFKNPIIMADEGGIFKPRDSEVLNKPYIGRAITDISKSEPKSVAQGYSLYIPVKVEV
ncbi:MAG: hypothetical protein SCARUB_03954 [Candidatus Scalindua rubra]|uniref:CRISPR system Cms protein Csm4 n=1 Tax=Candidatus Scalindua rubra TaxID=1872076 RepID=A0A1E3X5Q6_9BACT|nr:MAG: hypothetical protein SCARUB_03954 [Candidatus Scalindua rubra]